MGNEAKLMTAAQAHNEPLRKALEKHGLLDKLGV